MDTIREKIAKAILDAMDITDGLDGVAAERYAEAVLDIPEIKEALGRGMSIKPTITLKNTEIRDIKFIKPGEITGPEYR